MVGGGAVDKGVKAVSDFFSNPHQPSASGTPGRLQETRQKLKLSMVLAATWGGGG